MLFFSPGRGILRRQLGLRQHLDFRLPHGAKRRGEGKVGDPIRVDETSWGREGGDLAKCGGSLAWISGTCKAEGEKGDCST